MKDKRKSAPETVSVLKEHLQTAISSTDGTNVLNKIDTAIENEQKLKYSLKDTFYSNAELAVRNIKQADNQGKEVKY